MGLDIEWFRGLVRAPDIDAAAADAGSDFYTSSATKFSHNRFFPGRANEIEPGVYYRDLEHGYFCAGSYGGYNLWRHQLARMVGELSAAEYFSGKVTSGPFFELINFSDCEGTLGTEVCAKLAKDFAEWNDRAQQEDEIFRELYSRWKFAFEKAASRGAVKFK